MKYDDAPLDPVVADAGACFISWNGRSTFEVWGRDYTDRTPLTAFTVYGLTSLLDARRAAHRWLTDNDDTVLALLTQRKARR